MGMGPDVGRDEEISEIAILVVITQNRLAIGIGAFELVA
jgi:hypothetical protein